VCSQAEPVTRCCAMCSHQDCMLPFMRTGPVGAQVPHQALPLAGARQEPRLGAARCCSTLADCAVLLRLCTVAMQAPTLPCAARPLATAAGSQPTPSLRTTRWAWSSRHATTSGYPLRGWGLGGSGTRRRCCRVTWGQRWRAAGAGSTTSAGAASGTLHALAAGSGGGGPAASPSWPKRYPALLPPGSRA
jgi:hypothetical protein